MKSRKGNAFANIRRAAVAAALSLAATAAQPPLPAEPQSDPHAAGLNHRHAVREVTRIARRIRGADGIAIDRARACVYVAEEHNGRIVRVAHGDQPRVRIDADTPICAGSGAARVRTTPIRSPEGLAWCASSDSLYVAEDAPGGRLLCFPLAADGRLPFGEVVEIPLQEHLFAWESVDAHPDGSLLLAGSSAESAAVGPAPAAPIGVVLYRDAARRWWIPLRRPFASYSAAVFDAAGRTAFVACEGAGAVMAVDLSVREVRVWTSRHTFSSPESIALLPDGHLLVAEEAGRIIRLDPFTDEVEVWAESLGPIETVAVDADRFRLLVSADTAGEVLSIPAPPLHSSRARREIAFERPMLSPMVPARCPLYLAAILRLAGYDPDDPSGSVSFQTLARRLSMVALEAEAELIHASMPVEDPITHVQLAVFAPTLMGMDLSAFTGPAGAFAARTASGKRIRTTSASKRLLRADALAGVVAALGSDTIPVPYPAGARLSPEGIASLHLHGLGLTPDFSLVLNTFAPSENYLMVTDLDGRVSQYRLTPGAAGGADGWVIAIRPSDPEPWTRLDHAEHLLASAPHS